jgi:hypothetical protein
MSCCHAWVILLGSKPLSHPVNNLSKCTVSHPHEVASRQGLDVAGDRGRHELIGTVMKQSWQGVTR